MTGLRKKPLKYSWLGATAENSAQKDSKLQLIEETPPLHKFHIEPRERRIILTAQAIKSGSSNARFKAQRRSMAALKTENSRGILSREFSDGIGTQALNSSTDSKSFQKAKRVYKQKSSALKDWNRRKGES